MFRSPHIESRQACDELRWARRQMTRLLCELLPIAGGASEANAWRETERVIMAERVRETNHSNPQL